MFGVAKSKDDWRWIAQGKHPVAKDFVSLGDKTPLLSAFHDWVEKGYEMQSLKRGNRSSFCSWRFWAKGVKRHAMVCGLVRDSSDCLGRAYPLIVLGTGTLTDWEDNWDLLPLACEATWRQIEYLSAKKHRNLEEFREDFLSSKPPDSHWGELATAKNASRDRDFLLEKVGSAEDLFHESGEIVFPLPSDLNQDLIGKAVECHGILKSSISVVPSAVFMGGGPAQHYLIAFYKSLKPKDFLRLWDMPSNCGVAQRRFFS